MAADEDDLALDVHGQIAEELEARSGKRLGEEIRDVVVGTNEGDIDDAVRHELTHEERKK